MPGVNVISSRPNRADTAICPNCRLHQFRRSQNCLRCGHKLDPNCLVLPINGRSNTDNSPGIDEIGRRIRQLRIRSHLTQLQLATAMSTDRSYISRLETAKPVPTLPTLIRLARALHLDPASCLSALLA